MYLKMIAMFSILFLPSILLILNTLISLSNHHNREMTSSFECGFDTNKNARIPFSLHFFLLMIIFLVFDLEILLLLPFTLIMKMMNYKMILTMTLLLSILALGTFHEWMEGSLDWL